MPVLALVLTVLLQLQQMELPQPVGHVNDFANVLSPEAEAVMASIAQDVRDKSRGEIVIVTLTDLKGRAPVDVAREIGRQWKVGATGGPGDRARNTGVIILLVPKETSPDGRGYSQIGTGTGSEGFITDATAGRIQDEALPLLRGRDYSSAAVLMTWRVAERFAREFGFQLDSTLSRQMPAQGPARSPNVRIPPFLIFLAIFFVLSLLSGGRRGRRRGCGGGGCLPIFIPFPMGGGGYHRGGFGGGMGENQ